MPSRIEPLYNGLVTSRDASLLELGELSVAEDVILLPGSPTIHKAYGRHSFNSTGLGAIEGIAYCDFDTVPDKLVAVAGGGYQIATAGENGTFVSGASGAGNSLEAISVQDKVILLSGGITNRVLLPTGITRPHGLRPVTVAPGLIHTASGGTWPLGATSVPGFYEYWTTEVYKSGADVTAPTYDEVESTFSGTTATIQVTTTASHVTITRPNVTNPEATHWRVYRSNKKDAFSQAAFPIAFLIADIPINSIQFDDGLTVVVSFTLAGRGTAPTADQLPPFPDVEVVVVSWSDPGRITLDDGLYATSGSVLTTSAPETAATVVESQLIADNFGFTNIGSPITSIQVQVEGSRTGNGSLAAYLSWDGGTTYTAGYALPVTIGNSTVSVDGGQWGRVWNGGEFVDGTFKVLLVAYGPINSGTATIALDFVKVAITHSGSTAQQVITFPAVELLIGGKAFPQGANGVPPRADTGDLFQGATLMNDLDAPTNVAWTIPGTIDYVPVPYRLAVDDRITCIRALGTSALLGGEGTVTRMNYLPVAEDPEFNTGRAQDLLDSDDGIVSNKAAVRFVLNGQLMLFYVGQTSLRMTDAFKVYSATDDIIWRQLVNNSAIKTCFVENNAINHEILVFYPSRGSLSPNKTLRLSYDTTQLKNGKLKVVGITNYAAASAAAGVLPNGERVLYTTRGGTVYVENRGYSDASGGSIIPKVSSREMHLAGLGQSWELDNFAFHHQSGGGTANISTTTTLSNTTDVTTDPQSYLMSSRGATYAGTTTSGDGIIINLSGEDDGLPWDIDYLILYGPDLSDSAPLKS